MNAPAWKIAFERTRSLDAKTFQLQAVAEVGKSIASYRNLSGAPAAGSPVIHAFRLLPCRGLPAR